MAETKIEVVDARKRGMKAFCIWLMIIVVMGLVGCRSSSWKLCRLLMMRDIATKVMEKILIKQTLGYDGLYM